jgi:hypothetical protein
MLSDVFTLRNYIRVSGADRINRYEGAGLMVIYMVYTGLLVTAVAQSAG